VQPQVELVVQAVELAQVVAPVGPQELLPLKYQIALMCPQYLLQQI
jgi:hypothetical protein